MEFKDRFWEFMTVPWDPVSLALYVIMFVLLMLWLLRGVN